jgi:ABC-type Mn2+/Zn2+ transport system permease subunit
MIRAFLRQFFKAIPSDIYSFVGGAVFAISVDLAREYARRNPPSKPDLAKIAVLFLFATIGFLWIGNVLRTAQEGMAGRTLSREEKLANIGNRLRLLVPLLILSLLCTGWGCYLIFRG